MVLGRIFGGSSDPRLGSAEDGRLSWFACIVKLGTVQNDALGRGAGRDLLVGD